MNTLISSMAFWGMLTLSVQVNAVPAHKIDETASHQVPRAAAVAHMKAEDLAGFSDLPKQVRSMIESALTLTYLELTYTFGGSSPSEGGMDCSGTISHVLRFQGLKDAPRQSDEMCAWVRDHSTLHLTPTAHSFDEPEYSNLHPGDLVFWTGTYKTERKLPITHVMLYLGKDKNTGRRVMFGSSDGRYYAGVRRCGVNVFDFTLPGTDSEAAVYGFGPVPGLVSQPEKEKICKATPVEQSQTHKEENIKPAIPVKTVAASSKVSDVDQLDAAIEIKKATPLKLPRNSEVNTKTSLSQKQTSSTKPLHTASKKPEPSVARQALDDTGDALQRVANSIRKAFQ